MRHTLIALFFALIGFTAPVQAGLLKQTFTSDWSIEPWDYYGDYAAMKWHYIPYQHWSPSLGELTEVRVRTTVEGVRVDPSEPVRLRYAFFTGWTPNDYQLFQAVFLDGGEASFSMEQSFIYNEPYQLTNWAFPAYLPQAHYYFESRTVNAGHTIKAVTTLDFVYNDIPEPATYCLILAALGLMPLIRQDWRLLNSKTLRTKKYSR